MEEGKKKAVKAWHKVLPFGAQVLASAAAYSLGINATQVLGFVLKVSCATPVLGPTVGLLGVGLANALAGQASKHVRKLVVEKRDPRKAGFWEKPDPEDVVLDALLGACIFKAMGGRFSSLMPSDLSKPGALAFESIPAKAQHSEDYASTGVKRELARIFRRDGCHHCGSRRGPVIGDHMPPNKLVKLSTSDKLHAWVVEVPVVGKVAELLSGGRRGRGPLQRFFPQCQRCSIKQAAAMRTGKRMLVLHMHWPRGRAEHLAGVFVGLRYNVPGMAMTSSADSRRSSKWASLTMVAAAAVGAGPLGARLLEAPAGTDAFTEYLQQLPPAIVAEPVSHVHHQGWGASSPPHVLPVAALTEGPIAGGWQEQQQQQQQYSASRGSSPSYLAGQPSFAAFAKAAPSQEGATRPPATASSARGGPMQQGQLRQRQLSAAGDEARRVADQDPMGQSAALMAPEHAKQRAEAAFERHFAPGGHTRY